MGYWKNKWKALAVLLLLFLAIFYLPVGARRSDGAVLEALRVVKGCAREHVLRCLGPALSLPSMLVLGGLMGVRKTVAYVSLVGMMATATGWIYGVLVD